LDELLRRIPDFGRAYEPDGLSIDEFDPSDRPFEPSGRSSRIPRPPGGRRDIVLPNLDVRAD
jgi:hypothetical protein